MKRLLTAAAMAVALSFGASAEAAGPKVKLEPMVTGLNAPLAMVQTPDGRFLVVEQWGRIMLVKDGKIQGVFLDIRNLIVKRHPDFDERGLYSIALHPKFAENGRFYISFAGHLDNQGDLGQKLWYSHSNVVMEYKVSKDDPNKADPKSGRVIQTTPWPQFNHNGHWIGFGPDGMLYVSMGDGGYANDWGIGHNPAIGNGQDLTNTLGTILRIDPDTGNAAKGNPFAGNEDADSRIWAYGFRNPWRCSFDMGGKNELFCGDVQQNSFEEIDIVVAGGNYGWRRMEADKCFNYLEPDNHPKSCDKKNLIDPIITYKNCTAQPDGCGGISVTGGYVYRGSHKAWDGAYIYGDWSKQFGTRDGQIKIATKGADGKWSTSPAEVVNMKGPLPYMLAYAQDNAGNVYALTSLTTGPVGSLDTIYKIVPAE